MKIVTHSFDSREEGEKFAKFRVDLYAPPGIEAVASTDYVFAVMRTYGPNEIAIPTGKFLVYTQEKE